MCVNTDGWTDRRMDGRTDGQMDRWTDGHTHMSQRNVIVPRHAQPTPRRSDTDPLAESEKCHPQIEIPFFPKLTATYCTARSYKISTQDRTHARATQTQLSPLTVPPRTQRRSAHANASLTALTAQSEALVSRHENIYPSRKISQPMYF